MNRTLLALGFCLVSLSYLGAQTPEAATFQQSGIASWYGAEFEGRKTASGELFNTKLLTAAHPILPFGTVLRVTNTQNGKSVLVRVNDRGPFVAARILDVSRAAAEKLDMIVTGTAPVSVESVGTVSTEKQKASPTQAQEVSKTENPETPMISIPVVSAPENQTVAITTEAAKVTVPKVEQASSTSFRLFPTTPSATSGKKYRLQLGSYRISHNAVETFDRLTDAGLNPSYERSGDLYRIVLAFVDASEIGSLAEKLSSAGFSEALVREEH